MFTIRSVLMKTQSHSLPQHLAALKHLGTMTINDQSQVPKNRYIITSNKQTNTKIHTPSHKK